MSEPFLGQVQLFAFNFAPAGWTKCDGALLPISQNTALFSLLGTTYGGDGETTFGLPDLRGRGPIHQGQGPGLSNRVMGQRIGEENTTLVQQNLPPHSHPLIGSAEEADQFKPGDNLLASPPAGSIYRGSPADATMSNQSIGNTGNSQAFSNMHPVLVMNWCIALTGVFPSRN